MTLRELRGKYAKAFAKAGMGPAPVPKVKPPAAIKPTTKPVASTLSLLDGTEAGDWNHVITSYSIHYTKLYDTWRS